MNLSILTQVDEISKDLETKKKKIVSVLWGITEELADVLEETAQKTIFDSKLKGFQRRTGETAKAGLNRVQRTMKARGYSVSAYFWSRAGNLYENFKNRKRVYLYRSLKKYFEVDSRIEGILNKGMEELSQDGNL